MQLYTYDLSSFFYQLPLLEIKIGSKSENSHLGRDVFCDCPWDAFLLNPAHTWEGEIVTGGVGSGHQY